MSHFVYGLSSIVDNALYIGESQDPEIRFRGHINEALNPRFQGIQTVKLNWMRRILRHCPDSLFTQLMAGPFDTEAEAFREERRLVMKHRVMGTRLKNDPNSWGGEGGWPMSTEQRLEGCRKGGRKGGKNQTREQHSKAGKAAQALLSPEERRERGRNWGTKGGAKVWARMTPEERHTRAVKMGTASQAKYTPEERSARIRKGWETRRMKQVR